MYPEEVHELLFLLTVGGKFVDEIQHLMFHQPRALPAAVAGPVPVCIPKYNQTLSVVCMHIGIILLHRVPLQWTQENIMSIFPLFSHNFLKGAYDPGTGTY